MERRKKIIFVAGSAGSFDVLKAILERLPLGFEPALVIIVHRMRNVKSRLDDYFQAYTQIRVSEIVDKTPIEGNRIYVAPSNYHLLIEEDHTFALDYSELENHSRPSINPTFETGSQVYGEEAVFVLLSGANDDGVKGLRMAGQHHSLVIVQDPNDAVYRTMPQAATQNLKPDLVLGTQDLAEKISSF